MKKLFILTATVFFITACNNQKPEVVEEETAPVSRHPEWVKSANIYEVNVRQYTPEGTLTAFEAHLPRLKEMGVDILWFMPIQPIGELNRKGELGSYYSIADYTAVNPEFGTIEDFKRVVNKAHEMGMYVLLDWVANHSAFDHHWVAEHPEFYTADSLGNRPVVAIDNEGNPTDWTDVADLDYTNKDLWPAMTEEMRFWVTDCNIDGFRCDVAGFVPVEFWNQAVASLKETNPELFMLMEWEDPKYMSAFNMGYGWELHHEMNEVAKGNKTPEVFTEFAEKFDTIFNSDDMLMYFTTNHDENAWNGTIEERMGPAAKAMFVFATTFKNGMPLIYSGQEAGLNHRLRFFAKDTISWDNLELATFYADMLHLKHENPALWNGNYGGEMTIIETEYPNEIYAYYRENDGNQVVVFLNFSDQELTFAIDEPDLSGEYVLFPSNISISMEKLKMEMTLESNGFIILTQNKPAEE
jgi:glycosidase